MCKRRFNIATFGRVNSTNVSRTRLTKRPPGSFSSDMGCQLMEESLSSLISLSYRLHGICNLTDALAWTIPSLIELVILDQLLILLQDPPENFCRHMVHDKLVVFPFRYGLHVISVNTLCCYCTSSHAPNCSPNRLYSLLLYDMYL